jgi:DNA-binding NarL/FixJ family response regulator
MNRLILADDQVVFRAGVARVLSLEDDMRIVAQCEESSRVAQSVGTFRNAILIVSSGLGLDLGVVLAAVAEAGSKAILIADKGDQVPEAISVQLGGILSRRITGPELIEGVRRVARGQRCLDPGTAGAAPVQDLVGARVRDRLTPKEMQIVALIVQGCKNKDIANQLHTKEQVVKNYLRSIYDKTGVSDRLELALFTLHHRLLAEAAAKAGTLIQIKSKQAPLRIPITPSPLPAAPLAG